MNQLLRSEGSTTYAMLGMCSGCILNCVLDPLFIHTFGRAVAGAAGATALSKVFSCVALAIPYVRRKAMLELHLRYLYIDWENMKEVARMGIPAFLRMSLLSLGGIVTNNVARGFGTAVLAGIAVANKLDKSRLRISHWVKPYSISRRASTRESHRLSLKLGSNERSAPLSLAICNAWRVASRTPG